MVLGDGIRRNIASVDPSERALLRDAFITLNDRKSEFVFPGTRDDTTIEGKPAPGGVTWWFKQDEIHQATHVHGGPEFLPWHRELVNTLEKWLRKVDHRLSMHYWDWNQDPTHIPNAKLDGGRTGTLDLFTEDFMGNANGEVGKPWHDGNPDKYFYNPNADPFRSDDECDKDNNNPVDPPRSLTRHVQAGAPIVDPPGHPKLVPNDYDILAAPNYSIMSRRLENTHNYAHPYIGGTIGNAHTSFRDPFVFLLHSNVDRLFTRWQTDPAHPERLDPSKIYGGDVLHLVTKLVEPWSTGHSREDECGENKEHFIRPWYAPENKGFRHTYIDLSIVTPPSYDTNYHPLPVPAQGDDMQPHEVLISCCCGVPSHLGQYITSVNGRYNFTYQESDGNLVLYSYSMPLWASNTTGKPVGLCIMQYDGNLVIYGPNGQYIWDSQTHQHDGSRLIVQNDGNVVIYQPDGTYVWDTNTVQPEAYTITNKKSGKCLDVEAASEQDRAKVQQFRCHGEDNQRWLLQHIGGQEYTITNKKSGKCLDVEWGSEQDRAKVQQFRCHGEDNQRWTVR